MNGAIRIEQRLGQLFAGRRRRAPGDGADGDSAREMERRAVERLFAHQDRAQKSTPGADLESARETERDAMQRLYGEPSKAVVRVARNPDLGDD